MMLKFKKCSDAGPGRLSDPNFALTAVVMLSNRFLRPLTKVWGVHLQQRSGLSTRTGTYNFADLYAVNHQNLPRLPIPDLDQTLDRYIQNLR